ncbi:MAG: FKBP-type peptidyl-prolyl cis-trans isomerase [Verrucomicrobiales bacterium]|jgi:FKBP-type peptidyl-prolyl cis-trans isomerase
MKTLSFVVALATCLFTMSNATPQDAPSDVAAAPKDAERTPSGLASKTLKKGTGSAKPSASDEVTVHYTGWTTDGKKFDSSVDRGQPASFPLNGVIKGWTEGLQLMVEGEKRRFWIPAELGYGENPGGGRPGGLLVFDVELLTIKKGAETPKAPEDVAAPPADAIKSDTGLASKVLIKGDGSEKPGKTDIVTVDYSGWTTDGNLFDSSVMRGEPVRFPVDRVIKGWTEGVQLMVKGETRRFWIPQDLAYGDDAPQGAPQGMLVFDVKLLDFVSAPPAPDVPEDVAAVPADAEKTKSGLASKVLKKGTGTAHPSASDSVTVHYSGWKTDGELFDSSVARGEPASFPLNGVIKGWTEGVQLMVEGEKRRFWIPADLAYGENPGGGRPGGLLVFEIELLKIGQ